MRLVLVRHGETIWNAQGRVQGQSDVPLSDDGRQQAVLAAQALAGDRFDFAYASDLWRAWETAEIILDQHRISPIAEPRLHETHYGIWQGLTWDYIAEHRAEEFTAWQADRNLAPAGGETVDQVAARVQAFLGELLRLESDKSVLLVGHGGSLRTLICVALGIPPALRWNLGMSSASISELRVFPEGAVLQTLNNTTHLKTARGARGSKPAPVRLDSSGPDASSGIRRIARKPGTTRPLRPGELRDDSGPES